MTACPYCGDDPSTPVLERYSFTLELQWQNPQNVEVVTKRGGKRRKGLRLHNSGHGRWVYERVRDDFETAIQDAMLALARRPVPRRERQVRVTLTRLWGKRKRAFDYDNLVTGGKPIVDALVLTGALVDDSAKYARIHYQQRKRTEGGPCAVHVLIEVLDVPVAT